MQFDFSVPGDFRVIYYGKRKRFDQFFFQKRWDIFL